MDGLLLAETFDGPGIDPRLSWFNPPAKWAVGAPGLQVEPDLQTDFWQRTHYGFRNDNGHFLYLELSGDFVMSTRLRFQPAYQYDQAGLMVRRSADCWLKTSVEFEPDGPSWLGSVVTNFGYSDWATQAYPAGLYTLELRIIRQGDDYRVEYLPQERPEATWTQMRLAHLHAGSGLPVQCGLYACSPVAAGLVARFERLQVAKGSFPERQDPL